MALKPDTEKAIWEVVSGIPSGKVLTYGQIAKLAGYPKGARMVSRALKSAPRSMKLPWHRVVNAQGKISLPEDSTSYATQHRRLRSEGVLFNNGRINLEHYGWQGVVDELLWGDLT